MPVYEVVDDGGDGVLGEVVGDEFVVVVEDEEVVVAGVVAGVVAVGSGVNVGTLLVEGGNSENDGGGRIVASVDV